ncbi:autoinducer synthesis protein [Mesorhizobium sp. BR1-1-9]|uniref:acyl-homoserine-lactone synthase n=1 Tax=Mesorhizobium sp. BR1-1-9 TaxID=2876646 RepID=UPI001CD17020|nr:acyl-homoserine-lactone synthase [Mesorhizobium sp. BR1-1-9]MBZ9870490.1 autoinducer synthesis protein [Mesorhizobium sp. BR1-1-9]
MFNIHVVDRNNHASYKDELETHFRLRHEIYVGERGWKELRRSDGREVDAFDTPDAIYLLGISPQLGVVAGSRLIPSVRPHLMSEVFPELTQGGVKCRADTYEWTRFFVIKALRAPGRSCQAAGIVYCGIQEYCLQREIRYLTIVCEDYWQPRFASLGWNPKRLGRPLPRDGTSIIGLIVEISPDALRTTQDIYGVSETVLWSQSALHLAGEAVA